MQRTIKIEKTHRISLGTPRLSGRSPLMTLAVYLGVGAILGAIFNGPVLDPSSAWTWAYLLGWPFVLAFKFLAFTLAAVLWLCVAALLGAAWIQRDDSPSAALACLAAALALGFLLA